MVALDGTAKVTLTAIRLPDAVNMDDNDSTKVTIQSIESDESPLSESTGLSSFSAGVENVNLKNDGQAKFFHTVFVLMTNIVGTGLLSMPYSFMLSGFGWGVILTFFSAVVQALSFILIAVVCEVTGEFSYRGIFVLLCGKTIGIIVTVFMTLSAMFTAIAGMIGATDCLGGEDGFFVTILTDKDGFEWLVNLLENRALCVLVITFIFLAPLCLFRQLNGLRYSSIFAWIAITVFVCIMAYEYIDDSQKGNLSHSIFWIQPRAGFFHSLLIINVSYVAQFNVPQLYKELKDRSIRKFVGVAVTALSIVGVLYTLTGTFGYLIFGSKVETNILLNGDNGTLRSLSRIIIGTMLLLSFPISFLAVRRMVFVLLDDVRAPVNQLNRYHYVAITFACLAVFYLFGSTLDDISIVLGYKSALVDTFNCFFFPAMMFIAAVYPDSMPRRLRTGVDFRESRIDSWLDFKTWKYICYFFLIYTFVLAISGFVSITINLATSEVV